MLYHVTSAFRLASIRKHGLETSRSTGKAKRVWLVTLERLSWAVEHVKMRHGLDVRSVVCVQVYEAGQPVRKAGIEGVYWTAEDVIPSRLGEAFRLIHEHIDESGLMDDKSHRDD